MKEELDEYLVKKYPNIFRDRNGSQMDTNMCWGFQCADGWFFIINMLCSSINSHIQSIKQRNAFTQKMLDKIATGEEVSDWVNSSYKKGTLKIESVPEVIANQVKEKFGTLRFYCDGADEQIRGMISMAEYMSAITCEECGSPGQTRNEGWVRTLCDKHAKSKEKKEPINVGDVLYVLAVGGYIKVEVVKVVTQEEIIGFRLEDEKLKNKEKQYYCAKYVNNPMYSYWNAQNFDG